MLGVHCNGQPRNQGWHQIWQRNPSRVPHHRRWPQLLWIGALACLGVLPACGVTRASIDKPSDPMALPNLRRASEALQVNIVREKEHVISLNAQLDALRADEARVYAEVLDAEETYQRLRADADGVNADVLAVQGELDEALAKLETKRSERDGARAEQVESDAQLAEARQEGLEARREIAFWRGGVSEDGGVRFFRQKRLEAFRAQWSIPLQAWGELLRELGLQRVISDESAVLQEDRPAEPVPDDSLPAPEVTPPESGDEPAQVTPSEDGVDSGAEPASEDSGGEGGSGV